MISVFRSTGRGINLARFTFFTTRICAILRMSTAPVLSRLSLYIAQLFYHSFNGRQRTFPLLLLSRGSTCPSQANCRPSAYASFRQASHSPKARAGHVLFLDLPRLTPRRSSCNSAAMSNAALDMVANFVQHRLTHMYRVGFSEHFL